MEYCHILISDGNEKQRQCVASNLETFGVHQPVTLSSSKTLNYLHDHSPDLVICLSSSRSPDGSFQLVKKIRKLSSVLPILFLAKYSNEKMIIAALRAGVHDFLQLDCQPAELVERIQNQINGQNSLPEPATQSRMVGDSLPMQQLKQYLTRVAMTESTVLITGETGTGKEVAAELIQQQSPRRQKPFIKVNSTALPDGLVESELFGYEKGSFTGAQQTKKGKFERADTGTLFLDEICEMNMVAQAKLLRIIENQEVYRIGGHHPISVDVRIIASTNQDPERLIRQNRFRKDLYYRLNVARVSLPPLREHKEDINDLAQHFIARFNQKFNHKITGFTPQASHLLHRYNWPGNIRELKNFIESIYINLPFHCTGQIDIPEHLSQNIKISDTVAVDERKKVVSALIAANWNKTQAAQDLNLSRMTVYRKMTQYNIIEHRSPRR